MRDSGFRKLECNGRVGLATRGGGGLTIADVQHALGKGMVLEVGYTGNHAVHLTIDQSLNYTPAQYLSSEPIRNASDRASMILVKGSARWFWNRPSPRQEISGWQSRMLWMPRLKSSPAPSWSSATFPMRDMMRMLSTT